MVEEYHIDEDFQPIIDDLRPDDAVVWTNWLGMVPNSFREEVIRRFQGRLIIDNCHACFAEPEPRALCVYAFRKVAGVPHGAFLVASSPINSNVLPDEVESLEGVEYLELAKIKGSNEAYGSYLANERRIGSGYRGMNPMVQAAVCGMDWKMIRDVRGRNLAVLVKELGGFAAPYFDFDSGLPIWFPLYFESDCLRERLISRSIWVPRLWKRILSMDGVTKVESDMARWLLPLPIDQRYSEDDMRLLSAVVLDEIGKL